jgi:hypothetical protein
MTKAEIEQFAKNISLEFAVPNERVLPIIMKMESPLEVNTFRDALGYSVEGALIATSEADSLHELLLNLSMGQTLHEMFPLLYSLPELEVTVSEAIKWLNRNESGLKATGFATEFSGKCTPLEVLTSRGYFTKLPVGIKTTKTVLGYRVSYAWKCSERILLNPLSLPPYNLSQFIEPSFKLLSKPDTNIEIQFDEVYLNGSTPPFLKDHFISLDEKRSKFHDAKVSVFEVIQLALKNRDHSDLFQRCVKILSHHFDRTEIEGLLKADLQYEKLRFGKMLLVQTLGVPKVISQNGGLSELLWFIGHCENELRTNYISNFREGLADFVVPHPLYGNALRFAIESKHTTHNDEVNGQDDVYESWVPIYLDAKKQDRNRVDRAFAELWSDANQFIKFWTHFSQRLETAIENEFMGNFHIDVRGQFKNQIEIYAKQLEEDYQRGIFAGAPIRPTQSNHASAYPLEKETDWSKVTITLETTEWVSIKVTGQKRRRFRYSDLGFQNKKDGEPDRLWTLLLRFAGNKGQIVADKYEIEKLKTDVGSLRKRLREITGLATNPIVYSANDQAYQTLFLAQNKVQKEESDSDALEDE